MSATCIRCGAVRVDGPECPRCGVVYERAERRSAAERDGGRLAMTGATVAPRPSAGAEFARRQQLAATRAELWLSRLAVPGAILGWWMLLRMGIGGFVARTFSGMWLHELGHAVAAWLSGFPAFPGPWVTPVGEERSVLLALALAGGLGFAVWQAWTRDQRWLAGLAAFVLAVQLLCTLALTERTARLFVTFSGSAGSMVFGTVLMATFFVPPGHKLHRDWLRWGFLVLGAASFVETFDQWWRARTDFSVIGFGEVEGRGPTDATQLVDSYRWTTRMLTGRYVAIGIACLLSLAPLQLLHVRRTRRALARLEAGGPLET